MLVELDGQTVFADSGGHSFNPDRPCLVFIHGAQHDHFVWKPLVRWFADSAYAVLAIDLPGHGRSGGVPLRDIEAMADWLQSLLQKVGAGRTAGISLVGHSMGSLVALETAARMPERIQRLIMIGTAIPMRVSPALLQAAQDNEAKAMALVNTWSHSPRALLGACGENGLWLPAMNLRIMERQKPGILFNDLAACNTYTHGFETAKRLNSPITLIAGSQDRMTSINAARKLATQCNAARLVEIPACGHALMAEAPIAVRVAIIEALAN